MHNLRGGHGDTTKLVPLKSFLIEGKVKDNSNKEVVCESYKLTSRTWQETLEQLRNIKIALRHLNKMQLNKEVRNWIGILQSFQNDCWIFPVVTLWSKFELQETWVVGLNAEEHEQSCVFLQNIARYLYSKGFGSESVHGPSITDEMFAATVCAAKGLPYKPTINVSQKIKKKLSAPIQEAKFRKGFCAILEQINQMIQVKRMEEKFGFFDFSVAPNVEHILPKKWETAYFDDWRSGYAPNQIFNAIGNLMLLETIPNIKAANYHFDVKCTAGYTISGYTVVQDLLNETWRQNKTWTPELFRKKHEISVNRLMQFFQGVYLND